MPNEQDQPTPQSTNFTAGRDIDIEVGGDFIGRDKITTTYHYDGLTVEQVAELVVQLKHQDQPTVWNGRIPYLGLSAFQESDAEFFFGRETLVEELLGQVQTSTFITVSGPSGSGKSSIVRAGLFHALRHGRLDKSDQWLLATMTPQGNPQEQLALAVGRTTKSAAARDAIRQNLQAFPDQVDIHLSDDKRQRFVLLVDQFEETFTQTKEPDQRSAFIDLLTQVVAPANGRIIVILSLRSDFISNCSVYPALREKLSRQFQLVGAMSPQDLAKAITLPALTVGAEIDPALVSRIITDMKGEPGALPLMSFALRDLFEAQKSQQGAPMAMTLPEYLARGGLESALERHAQKVFETFTPEQVALAKNIFSKLIEVGQGRVDTRHTAAFEELIPAEQTADETQTVINALAGEGARLITTSGQDDDRTVTIAHERLIDAWPWLRQLVDENRELIALQNQITRDAQAWAKDKDDGFLYRGGRLLQIEEQLQELQPNLNTLANEFVQVSIRQQEKEKQEREAQQQKEIQYLQEQAEAASNLRKRLFQILSIAMVAVIFLIAAVFFGISSSRNAAVAVNNAITATIAQGNAEEQAVAAQNNAVTATIAQGEALQQAATATVAQGEALQQAATATVAQGEALQQAQLAFSRQLAAQAVSELGGVNRDLPLVLAIEAGKVADTSEAFSAIQAAIAQPGQPLKIFQHEGDVSQAQWNSSGNRILTSSSDGTAGIWDAETGNQLAVFQHDEPINYATWNGDESRVLTSSADGTARIWDAGIGDQLAVFQHDDGEVVTRAIWNPIETQILTISSDNTIRVWDVDGEAQLAIFQHERDVLGAVWNNTGSRILTSSVDGTARVWDVENEEEMVRLDHGPWVVSQASWNSDETLILTSSGSGFVGVWNAESGDQVFSLQHDGAVSQARWSANETRILTSGRRDGTARIWDVESGEQLSSLLHGGSVEQAEWNTDETQIMTGGNGYVMIWDLDTGTNTINRLPHESSFAQASWNADETRILTSNSDGVRVWDLETGTHSILFKHGEEQFQKEPISVSWNSTKTRILTTNNDNTAQVWDATSGEQLLYLPKTEDRSITQAIWNIDDSLILTINGSTVQVWDAENDDEPLHILRHDDDIYRAIWTNGNRILTHVITEGGFKTIMTVWDAQTGELLNRSEYNDDEDFGILWNADGTRILSITGNNLDTVTIWNVSIGGQIQLKHENRVNDAIWNIDGTQIATISGNDVQVWNVETGDSVVLLEHESGFVQGASWSADKKRISTIISNTVQVWDAETGDNIASLLHDEVVKEAKWNADGTNILTVSATHIYLWDVLNSVPLLNVRTQIDDYFTDVNWNADETRILINIRNVLQIWDVETGNRVAFLELPITPSENLITLNADETLVFAGHEDGTVRGYFVQMEDFVEFACEQTPRNMTQAEWQRFMGDEPYSATCPNLPLEE